MATLLVDVNLEGPARILERRLHSADWRQFAEDLEIVFLFFEDVGLDCAAPDDEVWKLCQERRYYLLTANRNAESQDSLGATIQRLGTNESLAVLTMTDPSRVSRNSAYLDRVIERLIEYLWDHANYLGVGRLFLP